MAPFLNNINRKTLSGRFLISAGCSVIGFSLLMLVIGLRTGDTEKVLNDYLPYLFIMHFAFWMLLVFAINEVLRKRFARAADMIAGRTTTLLLLLLLTSCLIVPADNSLIFSLLELFCCLLSLNLAGKSRK